MDKYLAVLLDDQGEDKVYIEDSRAAVRYAVATGSPVHFYEIAIDASTKTPFISSRLVVGDFCDRR